MRQGGPDRLRPAQVLTFRGSVQSFQLLSGQTYRDHLRRFRAAPRTAAPATLQLGDVVAGFSLVCPLLDLLVTDHTQIV